MQNSNRSRYTRLTIALFAAALISGTAIARGLGGGKTEHRLAHISQYLELDDAQQSQLQTLLNSRQDEMQQRRLRVQLRELVNAEKLDVKQMESVAASMAGNVEAAIVARSVQLHQFQLSLNQTQREKWTALEQRRQQHRREVF